jgi:hypothetical protein
MAARVNAEAHQNQRAKQREQRLFAGEHHHAGFAQLAEGIQRDQAAQILDDFKRPEKVIGLTSDVQNR